MSYGRLLAFYSSQKFFLPGSTEGYEFIVATGLTGGFALFTVGNNGFDAAFYTKKKEKI